MFDINKWVYVGITNTNISKKRKTQIDWAFSKCSCNKSNLYGILRCLLLGATCDSIGKYLVCDASIQCGNSQIAWYLT